MTNTQARREAAKKYLSEKVEDIKIRVPKEDTASNKEHFKSIADSYGLSLNQYAIEAMQFCSDNKQFAKHIQKGKEDQ
jgi:hypothetical protein|nr:hypothetical protein [uncultured Butyrivibrio sp.]